jgi:TRAP-type uncharacterized transport system substrate-binding protein
MAGLVAAGAVVLADTTPADAQDVTQLRWATSAVGTSGHRAKVALMAMLNREMPEYSITVMPTGGAAATIRGFATGQFDGYYGADVAFHEIAADGGRFEGFRDQIENELVQSFWAFTLEVGLGVRAADAENYEGWGDLAGSPVFTGPAPWDVRAALERPMNLLEVGHEYVELDTGLAGQSLADGTIDGFIVYTTGGASPAPWVTEAMLSTDVHVLNPSEAEIEQLQAAGVELMEVEAGAFETEIGVETAMLVPFYYGFHVGLDVPEDDVYRMLTLIEEHVEELVASDPGLSQIQDDMIGVQRGGIISTGDAARIHPGLARYLRERDGWDEAWDDRVAD